MTERYATGTVVWLRSDEGSIGEGTIVDDQGEIILARFGTPSDEDDPQPDGDPQSTVVVLNRPQVALTQAELIAKEPPLVGVELEEITTLAVNIAAEHACRLLENIERYVRTRWGEGSEREGVAKCAAIGALIGVGQGHIGGCNTIQQGVADASARTVAVRILRSRGLGLRAAELEQTGAPLRREN